MVFFMFSSNRVGVKKNKKNWHISTYLVCFKFSYTLLFKCFILLKQQETLQAYLE